MQENIYQAFNRETPGKVAGLMIASLFSLALLFTFSSTEASFAGTQTQIYDPFAPEKVMSVLDRTAASYSNFLTLNFISPLMADYGVYGDNLAFAFKESGLAYALGVEGFMDAGASPGEGQVAGAYTASPEYRPGGMSSVYSMIMSR